MSVRKLGVSSDSLRDQTSFMKILGKSVFISGPQRSHPTLILYTSDSRVTLWKLENDLSDHACPSLMVLSGKEDE